MNSTKSYNRLFSRIFPLLLFLISMLCIALPFILNGKFPGDLGDARFNCYILEHFYQVLTGKQASFINAPFFYPWKNALLFSDTHWGSAWIYALFRFLHISPEQAFANWFLMGFVFNFWVTFIVGRALGLRTLGAGMCAFIFSFSLPVIFLDFHAQLTYRFYVPLAFASLYYFLQTKDLRWAATALLCVALQLLTTIYVGVFLLYFLLGYLTIHAFVAKKTMTEKKRGFTHGLGSLPIFILAAVILAVAIQPYEKIQHIYGFTKPWSEIKSMLPHPASYLLADNSRLWISRMGFFSTLPQRHEQQMFLGISASICLLYALMKRNFLSQSILSRQFFLTVLLIVTFTLIVDDVSFYQFFFHLPGLSAIRAVARIIVVLVFPLGFIIGNILDDISEHKIIVTVLCFLIVADSVFAHKYVSRVDVWQSRLARLNQQITTPLNKESILILKASDPDTEVDAMLFAQQHGIQTINGYSGNNPPGFIPLYSCEDAKNMIQKEESLYQKQFDASFKFNKDKIIYVGFESNCKT